MFRATTMLVAISLALAAAFPSAVCADAITLLGFAEQYMGPDGEPCTHRGIDIGMSPGETVEVPMAGSVSFVGRVPGPQGGTVLAVTVADGDRRVTLMPLASTAVTAGQLLNRGDGVGEIASSGDPSSFQTHVHVGLRQGDVYVDPAALYVPAGNGSTSPETGVESAPDEAVDDKSAPEAAAAAPVAVASAVPCPAPAAVADTPREVEPAGGVQPAYAESGELAAGVSLAPGEGIEGVRVGGIRPRTKPEAALAGTRFTQQLINGLRAVDDSPLALASCFTAVLACLVLFARRSLARRLVLGEPMSHRWGSMLRALRAGDTICGLTSCSGHSAFTDPGPL